MMQYMINDLVNVEFDYSYLDGVIKRVLEHEKVKEAFFEISFVDEDTIQELNRDYRGIDRVTDVISFALEDKKDNFQSEIRFLGDIYICIPRMKEQALEYEHSIKRELSFLTVHGLLHLLGYDHRNEDEEKIMFVLQEEILNEENIKS